MTDTCVYAGDRDDALIAYLYDDIDPVERARFDAHLAACARCRDEVRALAGVRRQLAQWEPDLLVAGRQSAGAGPPPAAVGPLRQSWWREIPAWAQLAAALLFLGVAAGIANLDVRYDLNGLSVRTGWSARAQSAAVVPAASPAQTAPAPWRADLTALEEQLRTDLRTAQASAAVVAAADRQTPSRTASADDADMLRRVRALLDESERRQQRELALRVAEVLRDVSTQRQADLVKIDRSLGAVQNNLGVEVMKQRQSLNLLYRASQRQ
jgi:anti-sigma factor RsiW